MSEGPMPPVTIPWTNPLTFVNNPVDLCVTPGTLFLPTQASYAGTHVTFQWTSEPHNLNMLPNLDAFNKCSGLTDTSVRKGPETRIAPKGRLPMFLLLIPSQAWPHTTLPVEYLVTVPWVRRPSLGSGRLVLRMGETLAFQITEYNQNSSLFLLFTFVACSASQKYGGDFATLCGLLRIYELKMIKCKT